MLSTGASWVLGDQGLEAHPELTLHTLRVPSPSLAEGGFLSHRL